MQTVYHCKAFHAGSSTVIEKILNNVPWDGVVEKFNLIGCADAPACYAWSLLDGHEERCVTVLQIYPVISAETAVKTTIAGDQIGPEG